jgi:hypothetical protein
VIFRKISDIAVENTELWGKDNIFLSFDIDWAHDDVIAYTIDLLEKADVAATWFVTHDSPVLERLRLNPNFELGIHPNFNFLLQGDSRNGKNAEEVIDRLLDIVPEAKSVRSHSLVQGSLLSNLFVEKNLKFESNLMLTKYSGLNLFPFVNNAGITTVPFCWGDYHAIKNTQIIGAFDDLAHFPELRVVNFHPIHIFLNTEAIGRYINSQYCHRIPEELINHRYSGEGVFAALEALLGLS